jgi:hypothetical protein
MSNLKLVGKTDSNRATPACAEVIQSELDALLLKYASVLDFADLPEVVSLQVSTLPECCLLDEEGNEWRSDEPWLQTITDVNDKGLNIVFEHNHTGDKLLFEYIQAA